MSLRISNSSVNLKGQFTFNKQFTQLGVGLIFRVAGISTLSGSLTYTTIDNTSLTTPNINTGSTPYFILSLSGSLQDSIITQSVSPFSASLAVTNMLITGSTTGSSFIEEIITTTGAGNWTKPNGVVEVIVECLGGGGGGGGATTNDTGGGGGGGGGYARSLLIYPSASQIIPYVVGAGGTAGTGNGTAGGDTTWDITSVVAKGGGGGGAGTNINSAATQGNGGGFSIPNTGSITYIGGSGIVGYSINSPSGLIYFGAGGGAAGSTGTGGNANGNSDPVTTTGGIGTKEFGGNGGYGYDATIASVNGINANTYGGGGGAALKLGGANRSGGAGAQGLIRIIYRYNADPDAAAFIVAAGITDLTQQQAINILVISAKNNGWWDKCVAIYPFVGGTSNSTKYNLKDPRDLDAAYRITWVGNMSFSSNGITAGGAVNDFGNTNINASTALTQFDSHISIYSRTSGVGQQVFDMGAAQFSGGNPRISFHIRWDDGNYYGDQYDFNTGRISVSNANTSGYFMDSRTANNSHVAYRNGSSIVSSTSVETANLPSAFTIGICKCNGDTLLNSSTRQYAFATIGSGISSGLALTMYNDIQTFQTSLGRQV